MRASLARWPSCGWCGRRSSNNRKLPKLPGPNLGLERKVYCRKCWPTFARDLPKREPRGPRAPRFDGNLPNRWSCPEIRCTFVTVKEATKAAHEAHHVNPVTLPFEPISLGVKVTSSL